jgi:tetratricopeptide (TPR) repeat protein
LRLSKLSIFLSFPLLFILAGCSTTNHATLPKQAYHDITSHYNAYFNANEKLKYTLKTAETNHRDKYDSVLTVYAHSDPKEFASYSGDLEDVVKRSTQAIQLHGIANWSDDHMLLIGIANYLKGDYQKASSSFKYITTEYKEGVDYVKVMKSLGKKVGKYIKPKKKKVKQEVKIIKNPDGTQTLEKVDKRPELSLWVHEPSRSQALIWLIKTYTRQNKFEDAARVVDFVKSDDNFYKNFDPQLYLAQADLEVSRKNYSAAIEPLEKYLTAKRIKKKKRLKTRPYFVLAQCYEANGNAPKAVENYKSVLKSRPDYDMEFYAKLKMAKAGRGGSAGNAGIRSLLVKMTKDAKYKEYWDQVYYELALLSVAENNTAEARKHLRKSVEFSTSNDDQKALSYLLLAELDYKEELYVSAKFDYDTTLQFMAKNDSRYAGIEERNKMLDNLVKQLDVIATQDSLQRLAKLSPEMLQKTIRDAVLKKEREEEELKDRDASAKQQQQLENFKGQGQQQGTQQQASSGSTWYFYNTATRASGYNDFIKKWGRRKYEENWRRKNKSSVTTDDELVKEQEDTTAQQPKETEDVTAKTEEEKLLAGVPTTPEKLKISNDLLIDAYYTAGTIYKEGLESYTKALEMFETLNLRFEKHKLLLESYYYCYLIANKLGQASKAETYKALILSQFPESVIAQLLKNPNYINELKRKEKVVDEYYLSAYNDYSNNQLDSAWYKCKVSDNLFKPNPLSAKFELLLALVLSKQNKLEEYVQLLQKLSNKSTDAEVKNTATNLLSLLNKSSLPQVDLSKNKARLDSLNAAFTSSSEPIEDKEALIRQMNAAKEQARQKGADVKQTTAATTTTTEKQPAKADEKQPVAEEPQPVKEESKVADPVKENVTEQPSAPVEQEDTTSVYTRTDAALHYFIIYIKDPATPQSAIMSTLAKVDAFNSNTFDLKRLQTKQVVIDSKNKLINIRQFKNKEDVLSYFNVVKTQQHLFSDLQLSQYEICCISVPNFSTLLSEKDIDTYLKFFRRVYK